MKYTVFLLFALAAAYAVSSSNIGGSELPGIFLDRNNSSGIVDAYTEVVCVEGFKFMLIIKSDGLELTQVYRGALPGEHGHPQPMKCM